MIWDLHTHMSGVGGSSPAERLARLWEYAERMGVDRICLYMGYPYSRDPDPETLRRENDQVLEAVASSPERTFGFVYLNPRHVEASLAELERCVAAGPMVGVKLWVAQRAHHENLDPIVQRAGELQALVFQHTWLKQSGNDPGESTPMDLARLAGRHPNVRFVCGHAGGDWERGIRAVRAQRNIWLGTAGFDPCAGVTEMAVRELGAERILYGSDAGGRSFASQLAKVTGAAVSAEARRQILGGNLSRLLGPILESKGRCP